MEKIRLAIDANERGTSRAKGLAKAASDDVRFDLAGYYNLPVDVCFSLSLNSGAEQTFYEPSGKLGLNVELKGPEDYVSSVLAGRLYNQILAMRELQQPGIVVILGCDEEIRSAVEANVLKNSMTDEDKERMITLFINLLMDFEANSYALGIPIFRWGDQPYKRLLAHAHKILTGGSLLAHMPKPAEDERQIAALCMLVKGIGMKKAKAILESCGCIGNLSNLCCNDDLALKAIPGIGPTLAARIRDALWV
ncbi:MAG TPA: helix-hairpin-helix domain-containing protein [Methanotrichaceae archaeon]|nr:helix-hairpin-helix domain-containing protein [Methanotrichaceae archaeon]